MIEVQDFSKQYKNSFKISGISFSVAPGKITALVGANGSGKSTLIKAICGFHYFDGGKILVSGNDGVSSDLSLFPERAMSLVGYVPEVSCLPENLTVARFLEYAAKTHGISDSVSSIKKVVGQCSLSKVLDKKIKTLSKGYRQRVSLAQALVFNPPNLILDEPVSGLDPVQIVEFRNLLKKLAKTKTILFSTHILQEVEQLCDAVVVINNGSQIAFGTREQILKSTGSKTLEDLIARTYAQNGGNS